jgi:hypothetical protein
MTLLTPWLIASRGESQDPPRAHQGRQRGLWVNPCEGGLPDEQHSAATGSIH